MINGKQPSDFHFSLYWLFCINEIQKIENNHHIFIFYFIGCIVKIDQLIWKVNITVITTLETDWPQEAALSVVINSRVANWILNVGQIVPLSESHCSFVLEFAIMYFRFHFSGLCELEYYNCFAMLNICLKRKLEWPQSQSTYPRAITMNTSHN